MSFIASDVMEAKRKSVLRSENQKIYLDTSPLLQTSDQVMDQINPESFNESHRMAVKRVEATIRPSQTPMGNSDHEMSKSKEEDEEMPE